MNQTDKIMRQYFVQYPILKSVENYQCLVNFIFVFELLILYLCLLLFSWQTLLYGQPILQHNFFVQHNKFQKKSIALFWYNYQRQYKGVNKVTKAHDGK